MWDSSPVASTTTAGPTSAPSGTPSIPGAPSMKWTGASMWVPLCAPKSSRVTLHTPPALIEMESSVATTGSPGKETIPGRIGTLTSSHSIGPV